MIPCLIIKRLCLIFIVLLLGTTIKAQDFTNKGKDFWLCFPSHTPNQRDGIFYYAKMSVFITSDRASSGTVSIPGAFNTTFSVSAGQVTEIDIPYNLAYIMASEGGSVVRKGIRVLVDNGKSSVVVYAHIYAGFRSAASLILPVPALGKRYFSMNALQQGIDNSKSQFVAVAVDSNTIVKVTPVRNGIKGTAFTVSLPLPGDVYELQDDLDLSGSLIESIASGTDVCKKIAVFSGSSAINIATSAACSINDSYDPLYQQLYPVNVWGKTYGFIPFQNYTAGNPYRVLASEDNTAVKVNGVTVALLNTGQYYPTNASFPNIETRAVLINADKPVSVAQYAQSSACTGAVTPTGHGYGDPDMVILNPVEQNVNNITIFSSQKENIYTDSKFINILIDEKATGSFKINNNVPAATWLPVLPLGSGLAYAKIQLTGSQNAFTLSADSSFNAIAYGFGDYESYAYAAGTNVKDLYRTVTVENEYGKANFPASCNDTKFKIVVTYPFLTSQLVWKFNGIFPDEIMANPTPVETLLVNGKTVYRYRLEKSYQISTAGLYNFSVVAKTPAMDNCMGEDEIEFPLEIFNRPKATFNFTHNGCLPDSAFFKDQTDTQSRSISKWFWNFGDNDLSTKKDPAHKYALADEYSVTHWAVNDIGCSSDTAFKNVTVSEMPLAKFTGVASVCEQSILSLTDQSTLSGKGSIVKWNWDFGDNMQLINSNNNVVNHTYNATNTYAVSLQVQSNSGCVSSVYQQSLKVNPKPVAAFKLPIFCLPLGSGKFINQSSISDGSESGLVYSWNFGDASPLNNQKDPVHTYNDTGPYAASLKVISKDGCEDDSVVSVNTIYPLSHLQLTAPAANCLGDTTQVVVNSMAAEGTAFNSIYFDDGLNAGYTPTTVPPGLQMINLPIKYATPGNQVVHVFAQAISGCYSDTVTKIIRINNLPSVGFIVPYPLCDNRPIQFRDTSVANDGIMTKWKWSFSNNVNAYVQNPAEQFSTGSYSVVLAGETDKGCKAQTAPKQISVTDIPHPDFKTPDICLKDPYAQFINNSSIADNSENGFSYLWHFGDGNAGGNNPDTATNKDAIHKYTATGYYNVKLVVTSKDGCTADTTKQFIVNGSKPLADFIVNNDSHLCSNQAILITDKSTVDFGKIVRVEIAWDYTNYPSQKMVDSMPYAGKVYSYTYPNTFVSEKKYTVKYTVYSGSECVHETIKIISVKPTPEIKFAAINDVCEDAMPFKITTVSELSGVGGEWTFVGKGLSVDGMFNPKVAAAGIHVLQCLYTTNDGCRESKEQTIKVLPSPRVDAGNDKFITEGDIATLDGSGNGTIFLWSPAVNINNINIAAPQVYPVQTSIYKLTITSADGCKASDEVTVTLFKGAFIPNAFTPNRDGLNDKWNIHDLSNYDNCVVQVFNRYGERIFYSKGYKNAWDGTYKGMDVPTGVYVWLIDFKNNKKPLSGIVTVIR